MFLRFDSNLVVNGQLKFYLDVSEPIFEFKDISHLEFFQFRTIVKEHISKKHLDLENPIVTDKVFDDTK